MWFVSPKMTKNLDYRISSVNRRVDDLEKKLDQLTSCIVPFDPPPTLDPTGKEPIKNASF